MKKIKTSPVHQRFYFIYKAMLSYCLKCRKKQKVTIQGWQMQIKENQSFYQNLLGAPLKNRVSSKSKKLVGY